MRSKVPCEGLALKRGVPDCDGGGRGGQRWFRDDVPRHNVKGKRIVLRLCLYEEQEAGDEQRWELGGSNLEESCLPGKVVCPRIMEKIRGNLEGGGDVAGERHDEGKDKHTGGCGKGRAELNHLC